MKNTIQLKDPQDLIRALAQERQKQKLSQQKLATRLNISQPAVFDVENARDSHISSILRYALALGKKVEFRLVDA